MKSIVKYSIVTALVVIAVAALVADYFGDFDAGNVVLAIVGIFGGALNGAAGNGR